MESNRYLEVAEAALTKDHGTAVHHWINRNVFGKVLYFPNGILAKMLIRPHISESEIPERIKYETRLKIYNILYGIFQYFHYGCVGVSMLGSAVPFEQGDDLEYMRSIAFAAGNALLALHIRYNRKRVKKIMEMVSQIEERKSEEGSERKRRNKKNRKRRERRRRK